MKNKKIVLILLLATSLAFCNKQNSVNQTVLDIEKKVSSSSRHQEGSPLSEKIKKGAFILDVRTVGEFNSGHYKNAVNIPVQELASRLSEVKKYKNKTIIVYCAAGFRAGKAKTLLESNGFTNVTNAGGLRDMP